MNTKSYQQEIGKNVLTIGFGGVTDILFSRKGVAHIDSHMVDDEIHDIHPEFSTAETYGIRTGHLNDGTCDCFFVIFCERLWQRNSLLEVGLLLDALDEEHEVKQICET